MANFVPNLVQVAVAVAVNVNEIFLKDNTSVTGVDAIVFCTEYLYESSFITEGIIDFQIRINPNNVGPLYRETFRKKYTSLSFISLREAGDFPLMVYSPNNPEIH